MGAKFYFYPQPNGARLVEIDLGESLGELFFDFEYQEETNTSLTGGMHRTVTMGRQVITIQRDRLSGSEDLANKLRALENHLFRGHSCAFSADSLKSFCYPITNFPYTGDQSIQVGGDPFRNMTGSILPSLNDYIAIDTPNVAPTYEVVKYNNTTGPFTSVSGGQINLHEGLQFSYNRPAFARYYRFWPCLKLANNVGQSIITNENGILFSLALTLVVDTEQLFSFHSEFTGMETIGDMLLAPNDTIPEEVAYESFGSVGSLDALPRTDKAFEAQPVQQRYTNPQQGQYS